LHIKQLLIDSLKYPLSDWKKILILGIIIFAISVARSYDYLGVTNVVTIGILLVLAFIIGFLVNGYLFRILKSSLDDLPALPKFDNWIEMFQDGVRVFLVGVVYFLPIILFLLYLMIVFPENLMFSGLELNSLVIDILQSQIDVFILNSVLNLGLFLPTMSEISYIIVILEIYPLIVTPLFLMALANMANYDDGLISAFRFREILDEIKCIGRVNLIKWYLILVIIYFIIPVPLTFLFLFNIELLYYVVSVLFSVVIFPYFYIFFARAVALIYISE
jgi:hypothetical protein